MLAEISGSESSTEKEEIKNETLQVSNSNFLPCSWRKLVSISALTLFGVWFITSRMKGVETERLSQDSLVINKKMEADLKLKALTEADMNADMKRTVYKPIYDTMYTEMENTCGGRCCLYLESFFREKEGVLRILNAENQWKCESKQEKIQLYFDVKNLNLANSKDQLHLWKVVVNSKKDEKTKTDFSLTLGEGVAFNGMFWVLPEQHQHYKKDNAYLLCNFGSSVPDKLEILKTSKLREEPEDFDFEI